MQIPSSLDPKDVEMKLESYPEPDDEKDGDILKSLIVSSIILVHGATGGRAHEFIFKQM
jgi:hypothetical protein